MPDVRDFHACRARLRPDLVERPEEKALAKRREALARLRKLEARARALNTRSADGFLDFNNATTQHGHLYPVAGTDNLA